MGQSEFDAVFASITDAEWDVREEAHAEQLIIEALSAEIAIASDHPLPASRRPPAPLTWTAVNGRALDIAQRPLPGPARARVGTVEALGIRRPVLGFLPFLPLGSGSQRGCRWAQPW